MERLAPIKVCLLGLLAAVLPGGRAASGMSKPWPHKAPWFCHGLDCPHYTVTKTTDDYELRAYDAGAQTPDEPRVIRSVCLTAKTGFTRHLATFRGSKHYSMQRSHVSLDVQANGHPRPLRATAILRQ